MVSVRVSLRVSFVGVSALAVACASTPTQSPGSPPSPKTVTMEQPGGDAHDPHEAALLRQIHEPWGFQEDKDGQVRIPLVDWKNYERVRYWAIDHFVGFKYGKDYHVLNSVFILDVPAGTPEDSESCLKRAEKWGHPQIESFEIKLASQHVTEGRWNGMPIYVMSTDGYLDFGLERRHFSAAYAAYPAYSDACLVFGFAVPWREHEDLAKQVRDRWVKEGVPRVQLLTKTRPYRKD
jgi:hypothetical protein